jgi:putative nucleotidyltransferase with HDIG domain
MERHAVWLAALLHDIGKFQQRAVWGSGVSHQELGARWCEQPYFQQFGSDLAEAVLNHHNRNFPRTNEQRTRLYQLVQLADHLAAGERKTETRPQEQPPQSRTGEHLLAHPAGMAKPKAGPKRRRTTNLPTRKTLSRASPQLGE